MNYQILHVLREDEIRAVTKLYKACRIPELSLTLTDASCEMTDTFYAMALTEEPPLTPVSFLSVFCPDGCAAEVTGFTHPAFQRQGIFSELLSLAKKEAERFFHSPCFFYEMLPEDPGSIQMQKKLQLSFSHAECLMQKKAAASDASSASQKPDAAVSPLTSFKQACAEDLSLLIRLHTECFADDPDWASDYISDLLDSEEICTYLIFPGGNAPAEASASPCGLVHLLYAGGDSPACMMGLGILPAFQRKGLAGAAVSALLSLLPEGTPMLLHVSTQNEPAFRLYEKLGFQTVHRISYYKRGNGIRRS